MCGGPIYLLVTDKTSKTFIADGHPKRLEFGPGTLGDEFDAAIGQVADGAGDFKTGRDGFGGMTKSNALDTA